jgi:anti-sigma factor RsiW
MSPTVCQDVVEVLTEHLDGALGPSDERAVLAHLRGCTGCSTYLEQVRRTVRALRLLGADTGDIRRVTPPTRRARGTGAPA